MISYFGRRTNALSYLFSSSGKPSTANVGKLLLSMPKNDDRHLPFTFITYLGSIFAGSDV